MEAGIKNEKSIVVTAVSYTHLDVYKRQVEAPDDATCEKYVAEVVDVIYQKGHAVAQYKVKV